jgi:hypothetical protein
MVSLCGLCELPRNLGKFLPPYRWRFGQVGGFYENGSLVFPWLRERILFTEDRKGREDKPGSFCAYLLLYPLREP